MARTARSIYAEAAEAETKEQRKAIVDWAKRSEAEARINAAINLARSKLPVSPGELDANAWRLNVANGTLDLRAGELRPHRREDLITKLAPVVYDPHARCPMWLAFLECVTGGSAGLMRFLQLAVGYSLTGDTREQVLFLLYGTGQNGKSTFLEIVRALLGDYAQQAEFSTFLAKDRDTVRNDLADLFGARFVSAVEVEGGRRLAEALVKQVTGGDALKARFLFQEHFTFHPAFKLFLAANHKPVIRGTDYAIWRRIRLVPFTVTIEQPDLDLPDKLRAELPGILNWALEGCRAWQREGLDVPDQVREATAAYRAAMDVLGDFLADRCITDPQAYVLTSAFYRAYAAWCEGTGEKAISQKAFGLRLAERGFVATRVGKEQSRAWRGLRLLGPDERQTHPGEQTRSDAFSHEKASGAPREGENQENASDASGGSNASADYVDEELPL